MPHSKTTWNTGDVITAAKLNNGEVQYDDAIADAAASAQALYVRQDGTTPITGSQTVNGNETVNGDLTVNTVGGNGDLTVAYPGNTALGNGLTVGGAASFSGSSVSVGGILTVQGDTQLRSTVEITGQATLGAVVFNGPLSGPYAPGGGGGTVTGSGAAGAITKFTAAGVIASSGVLAESGSTVTATGTLNATAAVKVNGDPLTRAATVVVAASNSRAADKLAADRVCTGAGGNDLVQLEAALGDLPLISGITPGKVLLMEGDYYIGNGIGYQGNIWLPGVTFEGMGPGTVIHVTNGTNGTFSMLDVRGVVTMHDILVRNLTLDGNKANQTSGTVHGVTVAPGGNNIRIDKVNVINCKGGNGFNLDAPIGPPILTVELSQCTATGNDGSGFYMGNTDKCLLAFCTASSNTVDGIHALNGQRLRIIGCYATTNTVHGINIIGVPQSSLTSNICLSNTGDGIRLSGSANLNMISGNTCQSNTGRGLKLDTASGNTISANNLSGNTQQGMWMLAATKNTVNGNTLSSNSNQGLLLDTGCTGNVIVGNSFDTNTGQGIFCQTADNVIEGNTVTGTTNYGIYLNSSAARTQVVGNKVSQSNNEGIYIDGPADCLINGNTLYQNGLSANNSYAHIRVGANSSRALIQGNQVRNAASGNLAKYGVLVDTAAADTRVIHNDLVGSGATANFSDTGTRTLLQAVTPMFQFVAPPVVANWTWVNQGSATAVDQNPGIFMVSPSQSADSLRILKRTTPATPWTVTAAFIPRFASSGYSVCGLLWRESSSGKLVTLRISNGGGGGNNRGWDVYKWTNETTASAAYGSSDIQANHLFLGPVLWLQITDDGTNRLVRYSNDGVNFLQLHTIGRTDFLTANEVGFFVNQNSTSGSAAMTLLSWTGA